MQMKAGTSFGSGFRGINRISRMSQALATPCGKSVSVPTPFAAGLFQSPVGHRPTGMTKGQASKERTIRNGIPQRSRRAEKSSGFTLCPDA